ncbi:hypothetical protein AURDEDRAFT_154936 [Auricularia subglabra TFB-10046 SS5]|uniref:Fungal N-terminal domain-containing protein n=1 Tax=Auricularia subglabra (strain TFB-10046 / SS5) TaxID=717982 RepID=J0WR30_AURST|nr:hypothetical protein AURDEDRAFT_154936 [Auricularia subglabra TFB-10046 SS5]
MPIVAFSFGSFGDIACVLQLAFQLRAVLSAASGASAEVRALVADFDQFTLAIQQAKAILEQPRSGLQPDVRRAIQEALRRSQAVLRAAQGKIRAFEVRMTRQLGHAAWRAHWAALAWEILGGRKEVDALRLRLSEHVALIQTYLSVASCRNQEDLQATASRQHATLQRLQDSVQDIPRYFGPEMPSFMFENRITGRLYQPFARTSLEHCRALDIRFHNLDLAQHERDGSPIRVSNMLYTMLSGGANARSTIEGLIFKDAAGCSQVLLGVIPHEPSTDNDAVLVRAQRIMCDRLKVAPIAVHEPWCLYKLLRVPCPASEYGHPSFYRLATLCGSDTGPSIFFLLNPAPQGSLESRRWINETWIIPGPKGTG